MKPRIVPEIADQKALIADVIKLMSSVPHHTAIELLDIAKRQIHYTATQAKPKDDVELRQIEMSVTNIGLVNSIFKPSKKAR